MAPRAEFSSLAVPSLRTFKSPKRRSPSGRPQCGDPMAFSAGITRVSKSPFINPMVPIKNHHLASETYVLVAIVEKRLKIQATTKCSRY